MKGVYDDYIDTLINREIELERTAYYDNLSSLEKIEYNVRNEMAALLAAEIDRDIIINLFKMRMDESLRNLNSNLIDYDINVEDNILLANITIKPVVEYIECLVTLNNMPP